MSDLFNSNPFASSARQFAQSALKANSLAFEGFENIVKLQLQTVENSFKSSVAFLTEAADVADLESAKTIWPKGASLVKDSSEQLYATSQQVFGQALKTSEAIGQLYRDQFQAANDSLVKVAAKAKKAAAI
ncbi:MAG: phasin family protein [Xanthomonadales bacterium]|jgi:phasin family protein|nr:phasin family protein [Xanthomonadales bacterium]